MMKIWWKHDENLMTTEPHDDIFEETDHVESTNFSADIDALFTKGENEPDQNRRHSVATCWLI